MGLSRARAAARERGERVLVGRRYLTNEAAAFHPRRIEHLHVADLVREDNALAVTVVAMVDERPVRLLAVGAVERLALERQAVHETVPNARELDEAVTPERFVAQRLGVEAGG